jgi:hypothetical protein
LTRTIASRLARAVELNVQFAHIREHGCARACNISDERTAELPKWLHRYIWHLPHGGMKSQTLGGRRECQSIPIER